MSQNLLTIDGTYGEGGGQVLRSALTLALVTGRPFRLVNIRAGRKRPGLRPQHLAAIIGAAGISGARCTGAMVDSTELTFVPATVTPGNYRFDIGTAGSAPLVLQTLLLPLSRVKGPSSVTVSGGTHVPWSPSFHYLAWQWAPFMERLGCSLQLHLRQAGYYPRGGGIIEAATGGSASLRPFELLERGPLLNLRIISLVSNLPESIARRQADRLVQRLRPCGIEPNCEIVQQPGRGRGTALTVLAQCEHSSLCCSTLGAPGRPAEKVADQAADELLAMLATDGAIDPYLADQLLLPLALAPGSSCLRTTGISDHLLTNAWLIGHFLSAAIDIDGVPGEPGLIRVSSLDR